MSRQKDLLTEPVIGNFYEYENVKENNLNGFNFCFKHVNTVTQLFQFYERTKYFFLYKGSFAKNLHHLFSFLVQFKLCFVL